MKGRRSLLVVLLVLIAINASPQSKATAPKSAANSALPSEQVVNSFLRKMFGYEDALTWKITSIAPAEATGLAEVNVSFSSPQGQQQAKFFVTVDGEHAIMGDLIPFGTDPFAATRAKLMASTTGHARGPADAKLVMVEFADLECPGCRMAQSTITRLQQDFPNAKFVFQNYPLEQIHPWAMTAAKYVDCIGRNASDKLPEFIDTVFQHQTQINEQNVDQQLPEQAQAVGIAPKSIAACVQSPDTYIRIQKSIDLAKETGVTQTPTLFVNGRKVQQLVNVPYENVKQIVQFEADDAK